MPIGDQTQRTPYRQMELNPEAMDSFMHTPERMLEQAERLRQQAEIFEQQRMESETLSRELEENTMRKTRFNDDLNEVGQRIHNAVRRISRDMDSMEREHQEMAQVCECFKRHLQILSSLQPQHWAPETVKERLREALPKLDRADNDFHEAYACGREYRHTSVFQNKPGEEEAKEKFGAKHLREEMLRGLAFHLPLFLLLLITWGIYALASS
ncbi:MAG: hypothetical protein IKV92_09830 [Akkermansia sp.]|nr:hypothetical protein [Akkermansia sp.]